MMPRYSMTSAGSYYGRKPAKSFFLHWRTSAELAVIRQPQRAKHGNTDSSGRQRRPAKASEHAVGTAS